MGKSDFILISPIGNIPAWVIDTLSKELAQFFGYETQVEVLLSDIEFAHDLEREQYHSTKILEELAKKVPEGCVKIIGVTNKDLFIPILTHVYGEAQLGGISSVISIARLVEELDVTVMHLGTNRIVKEAIHELGHAFDLRHCEDPKCIMHYCRKIEDVDQKSDEFCRYCNVLLSDSKKALDS